MNRRNFLRQSMASGLALGFMSPLSSVLANGQVNGNKLIVLNLLGACDTVNAFPPVSEGNYYDIRPTIAIPENQALSLPGCELGMHPSLSPLLDIWNANDMALFPAVHCGPNPNLSHFVQFEFFSRGDYTTTQQNDGKGWLARYLNQKYEFSAGVEVLDFYGGNNLFAGANIPVLNIANPASRSLGGSAALSIDVNEHLYDEDIIKPRNGLAEAFSQTQQVLLDRQATLNGVDFNATPQNSVTYPNTGLGRIFRQSANLLRNIPEMELLQIGRGGWDHHANQGGVAGQHANLLSEVATAIRAFYDDMGSEMDNVTIVVHTEFGRTAHENGSRGTDHGMASAWLAIGGAVQGGQYGDWPGFALNDLVSRRYTKETIDYRDVFAESLRWLGMPDPSAAFPEYNFARTHPFLA